MKTWAYTRVSTTDQDANNQSFGVEQYAKQRGFTVDEWRTDSISGRAPWQSRQIATILSEAAKGDVLLVAEFSRLARSTLQVLEIIAEATKKGVEIHVVKSNTVLDGSMSAKIIGTVLALASEIERDFISVRTEEALAVRRAKGLPMGRPKGEASVLKLDAIVDDIEKWRGMGLSKRQIAKLCGCSVGKIYLWVRRRRPDWIREFTQAETKGAVKNGKQKN